MKYLSIKELIEEAKNKNVKISKLVIDDQAKTKELPAKKIIDDMTVSYSVMKKSIETGLNEKCPLKIEQNDGAKIFKSYVDSGKSIFGNNIGSAIAMAMAVSEVNASMGKIVASPTAGSCGIMPATLYSIQKTYDISDEKVVESLFTAAAIGMVIANVSSIAGASGGCQAECGAATAMAAAAATEMLGGDYEQIENAIGISLKNIEGLVCDPVAGLVECPCIKRNASGLIGVLLASDLALAGIKSIIPADEVILSMKQVGDMMDDRLRETALGGLAASETGKKLAIKVFGKP